ncbi:discoidin domain-containing protein [Catelliglobosispora koreensis]|uniref:discoidin domain-containing protein n=1 Tax=Catelliglobosispora koreensis TaxID=129052 RepID=UPI000365C2BE|nr:discoidin domain-containing protein [Catelliglobosispora koreensis]
MNLRSRVGAFLAVLLTCSVLTAVPAQADLQHPRQQFLRGSVGGLFLHWGMRTAPSHTSCSAWESAVTGGGWNAQYWVQEAQKLHTQYIVLATFHSRLGYARPWPSAIPGTCRTSRDFVRELIDATNAANPPMKTILYMTDDPQWWNEGLGAGQSWMNSSAYSAYKGLSVDLHTRPGFGEFSYDNFFEVMNRYPDLGGFWIDNDNSYWEDRDLYEQIHQIRPNYTLSNNNEDTPEMDMISNEQKTGMTPSYDYPQAVYTAAPRLIEADFKLPTSGSWWYTGTDNSVDYKLTLGRLITNAGSSVKALMAETPMKAGRMPPAQESFNNFANTYLSAIWESLNGTEGGGYMYGGLDPGFWNDGAHGVTTISKTNPNLHYVHVINRPSGSTLRLRDNGYKIAAVTNLRTGANVAYTQSGGWLTLNGISSWDQYDTVFKVVSGGREGIIAPSTYTMSASSSATGRPASAAADGNYLTYWDNNNAGTVNLRFDLGSAKPIQYVGINQREDSTIYPAANSARINAYSVAVSNDGSSWTTIKTGNLPNHRGVQIIDVPLTTARHVRLEKTSSHGIARLRVDEAWIGSAYAAGGTVPVPGPGKLEAEDPPAVCNGTIDSNQAGYSGTGFCNTANAVGAYGEWKVDVPSAGTYSLTFGFANGTTTDRTSTVAVNGTVVATPAFAPTGAWTTWTTTTVTTSLSAGVNTIRVAGTTAGGAANLDYVTVASDGPGPVEVQAETCTVSQGVVESNHAGFTGTGFVNGDNVIGSYVECVVTGPATSVAIRYANGTTTSRPMTVNGDTVDFPGTGAWTAWNTVNVPVSLGAGPQTIRLTSTTANGGPNLDRLSLT